MKNLKLYELKKIQTEFPNEKITNSKSGADFIRQFYGDDIEIFESFFILILNRQNQTTAYAKISQGGTSSTVVDVKILLKYAIDGLASGVIIAHNHPSGNLNPSESDKFITNKIKKALEYVDIHLTDHVILTKDSYLSFVDEGLI